MSSGIKCFDFFSRKKFFGRILGTPSVKWKNFQKFFEKNFPQISQISKQFALFESHFSLDFMPLLMNKEIPIFILKLNLKYLN
jgi:hypothetical protein